MDDQPVRRRRRLRGSQAFTRDTPIVERRGHRDYINLDSGEKGLVRRWDRLRSQWRYSALGKRWAGTRMSEWVISVPVWFYTTRKDGSTLEPYEGYLPVTYIRQANR